MHRPPAVSYTVVRSRWHFFAVLLLTTFAAVGVLVFAVQQDFRLRSAALTICLVVCAVWALRGWYRTTAGSLRWDGHNWYGPAPSALVSADGLDPQALQQVHIVFDFQQVMLVRVRDHLGQCTWVWLTQSEDPAHWLRMRRALADCATPTKRLSPKVQTTAGEP